ncbi:hypothetical protein [Roseiconus lacunae]|uniref:Uncharacterized protein n=1 Tax=Roseiconus lacunae TaxID=2605694 RepID=A0ABT7PKV8_9BACT|nr:hypothetical protein [Roseiconus lacunae]MDM4017130.1 hypothetical protein [Roseiconus lacunae]WRQ51290.1 hypothetical protein U8335_01845 [Stieleria sp. HD01]
MMKIKSTIRKRPELKSVLSEGTVEEPSIVIRTPSGVHDLLLTQQAYSKPQLRALIFPIKSIVEETLKTLVPQSQGAVKGMSVIIDLTVKVAEAIEESQLRSLDPIDATDQLCRTLEHADGEETHQQSMERLFGADRKPEGIVSFIASLDDETTLEHCKPIGDLLGTVPYLKEFVQIGSFVVQSLDASEEGRLGATLLDGISMDLLRKRLEQ